MYLHTCSVYIPSSTRMWLDRLYQEVDKLRGIVEIQYIHRRRIADNVCEASAYLMRNFLSQYSKYIPDLTKLVAFLGAERNPKLPRMTSSASESALLANWEMGSTCAACDH